MTSAVQEKKKSNKHCQYPTVFYVYVTNQGIASIISEILRNDKHICMKFTIRARRFYRLTDDE